MSKSPFPGMDPFLESRWGDVHTRFIVYACDLLQTQVPSDLRVRVEEHVTLQISPSNGNGAAQTRGRYPDIRITERPTGSTVKPPISGTTLQADPLLIPLHLEEAPTLRSIRVYDTSSGQRIVTAIEMLSPTNKKTEQGRVQYLQKQQEMLTANVNLVEIDLLRDGAYVLAVPNHLLPIEYQKPYRICVLRSSRLDQAEVYRASFREPLPEIRIPLRERDDDALLSLQTVIDMCYENGGYGDDIDYRRDLVPPFSLEDAAWCDQLFREKGLR